MALLRIKDVRNLVSRNQHFKSTTVLHCRRFNYRGGGLSIDYEVSQHVTISIAIIQKLCQRVENVCVFVRVFTLAFEKHQNHLHMCYQSAVRGCKVRTLSRHIYLCSKPFSSHCFIVFVCVYLGGVWNMIPVPHI